MEGNLPDKNPAQQPQPQPPQQPYHQQPQNMDANELVKSLMSNDHIPQSIRIKFWALWSTSLKLTFLTNDDVRKFMIDFEIFRMELIKSLPAKANNSDLNTTIVFLRMEYRANLLRARGFNNLNERISLGAQINANLAERPVISGPTENAGMVTKFFKFITGRQ